MRRRTVQPEIRSIVSVLRSPVMPFDRSDEECELFRRVQRIWQRKVWTQRHSRGESEKEVQILAKKSAKLFANFSATKVTSLPSLSLCLSLSLSVSLSFSQNAPHAQYRKRFRASYNWFRQKMGDLHHVIVRSKNSCAAGWVALGGTQSSRPMTAVCVRFFVGAQERSVLPEWPKSSLFSMAIA